MTMQQETELTKETNTRQKIVRALFFVAGSVSLAIGTIGIVLPILPTTPLLLLALACYCRSSKRMTKWVLTNKYFGSYIRRYKEGKGIPIKTKIIAIATLWIQAKPSINRSIKCRKSMFLQQTHILFST